MDGQGQQRRRYGWQKDEARRARKATEEWQGLFTLPPLPSTAENAQDSPDAISRFFRWVLRLILWLSGLIALSAAVRAAFAHEWAAAVAAAALGVVLIALQKPLDRR